MKPNFAKYSLALIKNNKIIYSSDKSGLRPLVECINKYKSKLKNCTLYDKVIGLAAAKLIVYSGMFSSVITKVISKLALDYLRDKINLEYESLTENILNNEKTSICPMELKAKELDDTSFINHIKNLFKRNSLEYKII